MSSLHIVPIPALNDNYIWLLRQGNEAIAIDAGQAEPVLAYVQQHGLQLVQIWVTHHHGDHTAGIAALQAAFPRCQVFGAYDIAAATQIVQEGSQISWQNKQIDVWQIAGHTANHLAYLLRDDEQLHVFCGDTLFSAGCGRVFPDSQPEWLYRSLQRIASLPSDTLLYPAHEYTASNLRFAAHIEPNNPHIAVAQAKAACTPTLPVSLAHEQQINPFLRVHLPEVQQRVAEHCQADLVDDVAVFTALREWKNRF
ncbi:hydroxyacylglutathione hydrolase [Kingella kingae]|uniref:hydroxyacylglutathione hydrolase n=1 Tax=Kingella kingae TaxID=504 RepID=UPI00254C7662|nr:hydroxyacylglutathione hydrolase [Kingella kingae]MDK4650593.1 hydroxyacylglutathione hydrolase [Kingella kingae]